MGVSNLPALDAAGEPRKELADIVTDICGSEKIGRDVALAAAVIFAEENGRPATVRDATRVFFRSLDEPVPAIEGHPKSRLVRRLLEEEAGMSDLEVEAALNFLAYHVAIRMQGEIAELLALRRVVDLCEAWRASGRLPPSARVVPGIGLRMRATGRPGWHKGADALVAIREGHEVPAVLAVVEVKSCRPSRRALVRQLNSHWARLPLRLKIGADEWTGVSVPSTAGAAVLVLPRSDRESKRAKPFPPHVTVLDLDLAREDLAACGQALVVWFLERLGEAIFAASADPEGEAFDRLAEALHYAQMRALGAEAQGAATRFLDLLRGG
jgi:hypothetical protein